MNGRALYPYSLHIDGWPVASFTHFGDANRAAFDDLPGFDGLAAACQAFDREGRFERRQYVAAVYSFDGRCLVAYHCIRGRLATMLQDTQQRSSLANWWVEENPAH